MAEREVPPGGWLCFQCGDRFLDWHGAQDHFGLDQGELPACVAMLTETEKVIVEGRAEWKQRAREAEDENETLGQQVRNTEWDLRKFGPDVRTVAQAYLRYEDMGSRVKSAEEKVQFLVERLLAAGVPWVPMPHDDRTPAEILGRPVDVRVHGQRSTSDVLGQLSALHGRMTRGGEEERKILTFDSRDTNTLLWALELLHSSLPNSGEQT